MKEIKAFIRRNKVNEIVWQNIIFALGVKSAFIIPGIFGVVTM